MTMQATETSVRASVVVDAPIDHAFDVFTTGMNTWWPPEHHILEAELAEMVFEPREGGHIYDRGVDGSECRWARILTYEPPHRFVISWDINSQWKPDLTVCSEVEIRFLVEGPNVTRVELEHRKFEQLGAEAGASMRRDVDRGWPGMLELFKREAEA